MRVVLVDDEPLALRGIARMLEGVNDIEIVGTAVDGPAALTLIQSVRPDLVFLDIQMPGADGLRVAGDLAKEGAPDIVFVTAFDRHAVEAFALDAVDYLLKPVQVDRLRQTLQRARRRLADRAGPSHATDSNARPSLYVPDRHGGINVPQADIIWIEAARDYGLIHTERRSFMLRSTMGELASRLEPYIIRVHRSAYVSLERVDRIEVTEKGTATLSLHDGVRISVGPSYIKAVRAALASLRHPRLR
jgi:DNA-binding LytR/AlgR family response regulator